MLEPRFRVELISKTALAQIGITTAQLAHECRCTESAIRLYQRAQSVPGGIVLGRMSQALRALGVCTSAGHLLTTERAPPFEE